jgi:hypothetical protein
MLQTEPRSPRSAAEGRECTVCPPWVVRCAHWDGRVAWLISDSGWQEGHGQERDATQLYSICIGVLAEEAHFCSARPEHHCIRTEVSARADNLPAAEAEFHRREAQLLGRAE